jgi:PAS domain S-box-containing protein
MTDPPPTIEILLVDDRTEDLTALSAVLAGDGYELISARSGADALLRALERDFAVIVLDVMMPDIDGFEVASLLRKRRRSAHTPIIFLTGAETDAGAIYRAYSVGAVDYLMKPVDADVLRAKVAIFADLFRMDLRIRQQAEALLSSERRLREMEIQQLKLANERRYRNLADAIPQIVWTTDARGEATYFNQRWAAYTGLPVGEAALSWLDAVHPDERAACGARWGDALAAGKAFELECRLRAGDGAYRWHLCRAVPDRDGKGAIVAWLGTHTDLDEVLRARLRAELLADAGVALASSLDARAGLRRLADMLVVELADACSIDAIDPLDEDGEAPGSIAVVRRDPGAPDPRTDGALVAPIVAGDREVGAIACAARDRAWDAADRAMLADLGRRAGAAVENARQYARAERAVRVRDEFLSVASHELRTPLSALMLQLGGLEHMIADGGADDRIAKKTAAALRHTHRLAKLVESLLDVSRLAAGRLTLTVEDCDLGELVQEVTERLGDEARRAGCPLIVRAQPGLHGACDRLRVEQVLTNLLGNALKYGAGHPIEIDVGEDLARDAATVTVRDHGIGIAPDDLPRIFDRFERAAPARHYGGLGLGLYIAREIVQAHGGWIRADSVPGDGATFTVGLPSLHAESAP